MFCYKCGVKNSDSSKFCKACGTNLNIGSTARSTEPQPVNIDNIAKSTEPQPVDRKTYVTSEKNYYEILRVDHSANVEEINAAIKKQRTLWSSRIPRGGTMGARARQILSMIGEAEETLLDSSKRAAYDATLSGENIHQDNAPGEKNWLDILYSYYDQHDWEMAGQAVERATMQQPDNPDAWFLAAIIYHQLNDYNKANSAAQQLLLLDPENPAAYEIRGDVLLAKNNDAQAIEMYNKMKLLAKDQETVRQAEECIIVARANGITTSINQVLSSIPEQFEYDRQIMQQLKDVLSQIQRSEEQEIAIFNEARNPSPWLKSCQEGFITVFSEKKNALQRLINEGNEKVHLPGFWLSIICWVIAALISFGIMSVKNGAGAGFMLLTASSLGFGFRAFYAQTKPRYKVNEAFMWKHVR